MTASIGNRLRDVRKRRGLTQQGLARGSGVSVSLIRDLEQGVREDTRLETVRKLAQTLRVPTSHLMVESVEPAADPDTVDRWAPVRQALEQEARADDLEDVPTVTGVKQALEAALPLLASDRFLELGWALPHLLRDSEILSHTDPEGRVIRVQLLQLTGWLLTQTRQTEAAEMALELALDMSSDRIQGAATVNTMCWLLLRRGRLEEARNLAITWADDMEPRMSRATPEELCTWGSLLLRVSAASVRDNRPGEAKDALRLAHSAAVAVGREYQPRQDFVRTFGPTTVALKQIENASVTDHPDQVLTLSATIPSGGLRPTSNNRNRHRLDLADAYAKTRQYGQAIGELTGIWQTSPQWLPNQRYAKDILGRIIDKRRTLTEDMRTLADAMGMPL
ncbi:helix-turn-helix domain-containing protein [Streptomyces sp. NPDC057638]|uniref:helix-turn-helix domain-containing protein n=1 Tax=Streptomyces sp. NPDC057638 TaxID=3346190 RepID=UPI0036A98409